LAAPTYTEKEVGFLRALTYPEALRYDSSPRDSWPDLLSSDVHTSGDPIDDSEVLVVLRWHDVQQAAERVVAAGEERISQLRGAGYTEAEIAEVLGCSQQSVSRRYRASLAEILAELNGHASAHPS
jgi:DNA-directed RNA polymerase specialized sigma24 family protein